MKIFIAGGAGFIGSHVAARMLTEYPDGQVVVYDAFTSGSMDHLAALRGCPGLVVVEGDIKDVQSLRRAMSGAGLVVHLAANPDIAKAATTPDIDFWDGTLLTQNILEAMRVNAVPALLYASGSGVYGEVPGVRLREDFGPCVPISTYGASKLACEGMVAAYCHMFGLRARAFRFANVVGPRQTHGVGYDFIRRLRDNPARLRILGDGSQCKSYIHVEEIVVAILLAAARMEDVGAAAFDVFNVGPDDAITVTEIADLACAVAGLAPGSVRYDFTGGDRGWKGDVPRVTLDSSKIRSLGWQPRRGSAEAMRSALSAMLAELEA